MKKYSVIVLMIALSAFISGCTVNAAADQNVTYPVLNKNTLDDTNVIPYKYEMEEVIEPLAEPIVETRDDYPTVEGGADWMYAQVSDGVQGFKKTTYRKTYNINGVLLSRIAVPELTTTQETVNTVFANGQAAQPGATYTSSKVTRYGVDCVGCNMNSQGRGSTSSGVQVGLDEVRQRDGSWQKGVTYEGYYIIATSATIPLCSVVEISDHPISGAGIQPGVPFRAIVLDRGGAITGSKIDLYAGSQAKPQVTQSPTRSVEVKIISLNARTQAGGVWNCAL